MDPLPKTVRYALAVAASAVMMLSGSVGAAVAALPESLPVVAITPSGGPAVGVGMPVTVTFGRPVADRGRAEGTIEFSSPKMTKAPAGTFSWLADNKVQFTPTTYWPAHSSITVSVGGVKQSFETATATLGVASISGHTFTVSIDGQVVKTMPASMGKPKHPTPVGSFTAMSKESPVVMDSRTIGIPLNDPEGYKLTVYYAVRVTSGGVYVHAAPWSVAQQGNSNVSHGCINLSTDNASWYYNQVNIGDPIVINA
ncbi:L,D-transpeptidase [Mycolicibacterium mucogenicum]|uniref:L,D-transpeptidase n=2 Tax=Mycobacteriaceae TaxID=1762 RepID=A0A8H2JCX9_MYCMU|nr:L,D-transpeptidase [Mycolicibacterium mucogenicum DSM 44124]SEA54090.1 Lipoprotein-anchoring transpeptidase ErfK/SrfK [Mycobacterium sp. 283mftsu]